MLRFGTDGVRGNAEDVLTTPLVVALGRGLGRTFAGDVLIGRDTRESGERIVRDLARGLAAEGSTPVLLGVAPTPQIAASAAAQTPAAIVSASHNPWPDNGVKVVGPDGAKLADDLEAAIERELNSLTGEIPGQIPGQIPDGPVVTEAIDHADLYGALLTGAFFGRTLDGLRVVMDCANGATFAVGPEAFRVMGADLVVIHAEPNGRNINEACGSTHPESLQAAVVEHGAAVGLALDGDGDRVLAVDEHGALVDGDQIIVMCALDLHARGELTNDAVAVTVMSNLGLRRALRAHGIDVVETPVGDRHVVAAMRQRGLVLGGEQSGHIIYSEFARTGDGLLTGLMVCDLMQRSGRPLSELAAAMTAVPQILENVRVARPVDVGASAAVSAAVREATERLGDRGRVLVRASGTEPLVRIMVEADEQAVATMTITKLRSVVEAEFGGK